MKAENRVELMLEAFKQACFRVLPSLQQADFDLIMPHLKLKSFNKGDLVLKAEEVCNHIFFLPTGLVRMYYLDADGNQINYRFTEGGNFFVDFQSFLTKKPSHFYWEAMERIEVLTITHQAVQEIYQQSATWSTFGRIMAEQVYLQLNERVEMLLFMQPEARYLQMQSKYPNLIGKVAQLHIASYLGIKPETLSRIRKRMVKR
jgi:CRP-like cAMP-binding protein